MKLLEAKRVSRTLGGQQLFKELDLVVNPGDVVLLKGPNGSGKSTFLRALSGQQPVDEGVVQVAGRPVEQWKPPERENWAPMVDQDPVLNWDVSAVDNLVDRLTVGPGLVKWLVTPRARTRKRILDDYSSLIDAFGLTKAMRRLARELSLGQRRMLTLLRALRPWAGMQPKERPRILLLDEPLAGLQYEHVKTVLSLLRQRVEARWAVVVAEHLNEIEELDPKLVLTFPAIPSAPHVADAEPSSLSEALTCPKSTLSTQAPPSGKPATTGDSTPQRGETIFSLRDGAAGYYEWKVVSEINLPVRNGEITAIVGPNAAGKTTLFRGLFNSEAWFHGVLRWKGLEVQHLRNSSVPRDAVAWVPQERPVFEGMTVEEVLRGALLGKEFQGITAALKDLVGGNRHAERLKVDRVCRFIDDGAENGTLRLGPLLKKRMETLSGGERAIVSLAIGLINRPKVLFLDEPAANLDPKALARVKQMLRCYVDEHDAACIVIEHRASFIDGLFDRRITLNVDGKPDVTTRETRSLTSTPGNSHSRDAVIRPQ